MALWSFELLLMYRQNPKETLAERFFIKRYKSFIKSNLVILTHPFLGGLIEPLI